MKKLVSLLVVLAMLMTMAPAVFAEEEDNSAYNPAQLLVGETNTFSVEEGGMYWLSWTAEEAGTLTIAFESVADEIPWCSVFVNTETYADPVARINGIGGSATVDVEANDVVLIKVEELDGLEATFKINATFTVGLEGSGTQIDPWILETLEAVNGTFTSDEDDHYYQYTVAESGTYTMDTFGGCNIMVFIDEIVWGEQVSDPGAGFSVEAGQVIYLNMFYSYGEVGAYFATFSFVPGEGTGTGGGNEAPVGSLENPEPLADGYYELATDYDGHYYTWTSDEETLFVVEFPYENWSYCILVERDGEYVYEGGVHSSTDDVVVPMEVVLVQPEDVVTLFVSTATRGDGIVAFSAYATKGMEDSPISPVYQLNAAGNKFVANIILPETYVYIASYHAKKMNMTVNGEDYGLQAAGAAVRVDAEGGLYTIECSYPLGSSENMHVVGAAGGDFVASVEAANYGYLTGYYYVYHATSAGELTITVGDEDCTTWYYQVKGSGIVNQYGGSATLSFDSTKHTEENPQNTYTVTVQEGYSIIVWVCTAGQYKPAAAADVPVSFSFHGLGDVDGNGKVNTLDVMKILQYKTGKLAEDKLDLTMADVDGNDKVNTLDAMKILHYITKRITRFPVEEVEVSGTLVLGENELAFGGTGDYEKKLYTYTAENAGTLYFTVRSFYQEGSDSIVYNDYFDNLHQTKLGINGEFITNAYTYSVEVEAGQVVEVMLYSLNGDACEVTLDISEEGFYVAQDGDREKPIVLNPEQLPQTDTVAAEDNLWYLLQVDYYSVGDYLGGELKFHGENIVVNLVYFDYDKGEFVYETQTSVDGVVTVTIDDSLCYQEKMIQICNNGTADTDVEIKCAFPLGHKLNPDTFEVGKLYELDLDEGESYAYAWTATETGKLVLTVTGDYWSLIINDRQVSGAAGASGTQSVIVEAGDEVVILVTTSDGNSWMPIVPGDFVTLTSEFRAGDTSCDHAALGAWMDYETGALTLECSDCGETMGVYTQFPGEEDENYNIVGEVTVAAGETVYYYVTYEMQLAVTDADGNPVTSCTAQNVYLSDFYTTALFFTITNEGTTEATYNVVCSFAAAG